MKKKGRDFFKSRKREPERVITGIQDNYPFEEALKIGCFSYTEKRPYDYNRTHRRAGGSPESASR